MLHKATSQRGQNLIEFAFVLPIMAVLVLGLIDLGNALYMANGVNRLSREGANLVAREVGITDNFNGVLDLMMQSANPPLREMLQRGCIYISKLEVTGNTAEVKEQAFRRRNFAPASRLPGRGGRLDPNAQRRIFNDQTLNDGEQVAVVEVYYQYMPITPIGNFGLIFQRGPEGPYLTLNSMATFFLKANPPSP